MKAIPTLTKGPKKLVAILNQIISALNGMTLINGRGIVITRTSTGWIISTGDAPAKDTTLAEPGTAPSGDGGGSGGTTPVDPGTVDIYPLKSPPNGDAQWRLLNVVIDNGTGGYTVSQMWVWGTQLLN